MTNLQLTPEGPPPGTPDEPDAGPAMDAPGADEGSEMRLERDELQRASDEGMTAAAGIGDEADPPDPEAGSPLGPDDPSANPGFEEGR